MKLFILKIEYWVIVVHMQYILVLMFIFYIPGKYWQLGNCGKNMYIYLCVYRDGWIREMRQVKKDQVAWKIVKSYTCVGRYFSTFSFLPRYQRRQEARKVAQLPSCLEYGKQRLLFLLRYKKMVKCPRMKEDKLIYGVEIICLWGK